MAHAGDPGTSAEGMFDDLFGIYGNDGERRLRFDLRYRPRLEKTWDGNLGFNEDNGSFRITHQAQLGFSGSWGDFAGRIAIRDVRRYAPNTSGASGGMDVFEAWAEWAPEHWRIRVGVLPVTFGTGRNITSPPWSQRGRPVDGLRIAYNKDGLVGELLASRYHDGFSRYMFGAHGFVDFGEEEAWRIGIESIAESNEMMGSSERRGITEDWTRGTAGAYFSKRGDLSFGGEAFVQVGEDIFAWMFHARTGYRVNSWFAPVLWLDVLSGDPDHDDNTVGTYNTSIGYRHRYYGRIDRFVNISRDTADGGLVDFSLLNDGAIGPGKLHTELHLFMLHQENRDGDSGVVGAEVDFHYGVKLHDAVKLTAGFSLFYRLGDFQDDDAPSPLQDWFFLEVDLQLPGT